MARTKDDEPGDSLLITTKGGSGLEDVDLAVGVSAVKCTEEVSWRIPANITLTHCMYWSFFELIQSFLEIKSIKTWCVFIIGTMF